MNFNVRARTIFYCRHGSHAYGLNVPTSDEDFKGVCVKPREAYFGFTQRFEQHEHMGSKSDGVDSVTYSLEKFAALAADCNPNIIEILHVADKHVLQIDEFGEELRSHRNEFLSKKAKFTFSGYAHAQLKRIKTHRAWLLDPPKAPPSRKDFGLSETSKVSKSELGAFDSMVEQGHEVELPKDVVTLFVKEKAYQAAKTHYDQYLNWVKTRNPARAELEAKFGYDTKHGMHLLRLQRMAKEILVDHVVYVDREARGDREELLKVRFGKRSYDSLIEEAESLEAECEQLYQSSTLRKEPNRAALDKVIVDMTDRYLRKHG
jgi:predicted nucleotidyltransferase